MEERRTKFYSSCRDGHIEIVSLNCQFYDMIFALRVSRSNNIITICFTSQNIGSVIFEYYIECRTILKQYVSPCFFIEFAYNMLLMV